VIIFKRNTRPWKKPLIKLLKEDAKSAGSILFAAAKRSLAQDRKTQTT
jgi:hypothetical protein